jgi:hypothetical protein
MDKKVIYQRLGILLAYPLAYAYVRLLLHFSNDFILWVQVGHGGFRFNYAYPIFALLFIIVNEIVRRGRRGASEKIDYKTVYWYAVTFLAGLTATIGEGHDFHGLEEVSVLGMHLSAVYSVLVSNNILLGGKTSGFIPADLIHGFYVKSFAGFPNFITDWKCFGKPKAEEGESAAPAQKKHILGAIVFVMIMGVLMIISVALMSSIDEDIRYFFENFTNILDDYLGHLRIDEIFARCVFAIPVCFYLYGLMSRSAKSDGAREKRVASWLLRVRGKGKTVSATLVYIAAGIFVVAYILFFVKRLTYMLGGFAGDVPDGMLVSRYAQEGFWQMVGIAAVNLCVYLAIILLGRSDSDGKFSLPAKILVTILMVETIAFAVIAMSKIGLYYSIYGYTPKRILAMWATMSLTFAAVLTILTVHQGKPHFRAGVIFTSASYIAICILSAVLVAIGA